MQAIRMTYKGIKFRSKLEAQWAKFFDSYGIKWCYEPEGFKFSDGTTYLPDFYLPESKSFFEVKGFMCDKDIHKIKMLISEGNVPVIVGYSNGEFEACDNWGDGGFSRPEGESHLAQCNKCGKHYFVGETGSYTCLCCGFYDGTRTFYVDVDGDDNHEWNKRATIDYLDNKF